MNLKLLLFTYIFFSAPSIYPLGEKEQTKTIILATEIKSDTNSTAKMKYTTTLALWESKNISDYYMKIKYSAFSPIAGIYEIFVINGKLTTWIFKGKENSPRYKPFAENMLMDKLFIKAQSSFNNKVDSMFIFTAKYDILFGNVSSVQLNSNPDFQGNIPTDKTYKINITDFKIINKTNGEKND